MSIVLLYTSNEYLETEKNFKVPFIVGPKNIKYISISPTKYVQSFYVENYRT